MTTETQRDRMDLGELGVLLLRNRRMIFAGALGVLAAIAIGTLVSHMEFKARGSLFLGELQGRPSASTTAPDPWDFVGSASGDVGTEVEILKSQELVKRTVFESGLNVVIEPFGWTVPRYWSWRLAHRDPRLLDVAARHVVATRGAVTGAGTGWRQLTVRFMGAGTYEVWNRQQRLGTGSLGAEFQGGEVRVTLLAGPEGAPAVGDLFKMVVTSVGEVADDAAKRINVSVPKISPTGDAVKVVGIDFTDPSPRAAALFVATLMRAYLDRRQSWKTEEATLAETFVGAQVGSMKAAVDEAERKLADYKMSSNVVALSDEAKGMVDQIGKYEEQRVAARLQVASFEQIQQMLKQPNAPIEQFLVGEGSDQVLAGLSSNLAQAQQELRRVEERFTPDAPAAREQKAQVDGQLRTLKAYVVGRSGRAQKQLESVNDMIGQFERKLKTVPSAQLDLARLARNTEVLNKMYSFLLERQQQAAVTKASTISRNRILDTPDPPGREDSPAAGIRALAGLLLGLLLGMFFVIMRRMLAPTYQTERELRFVLGELPVLATVPELDVASVVGRRARLSAPATALPSAFGSDPGSAFSEAFRYLRTNIYCADRARGERVVLITSPTPGDGKTLCTFSLAAALTADEKRVLVIEGDMRRPVDAERPINLKAQPLGLSSVLRRRSHWSDVVRTIPTGFGNYDLIPAGVAPPSPAELLSSPYFHALLDDVRRSYDIILIDSPPFPLVADALIMAMHVDRVLSVLRPRNTLRRAAEEHMQRFAALGVRHAIVINGADMTTEARTRNQGGDYFAKRDVIDEAGRRGRISAPA